MLKLFRRKAAKTKPAQAGEDTEQATSSGTESPPPQGLADPHADVGATQAEAACDDAAVALEESPADAHAEPAAPLREVESAPDEADEVDEASDAVDQQDAEQAARGWRKRLSGSTLARGMGRLFERNPRLDDALLDELESTLITADVGVETTTAVCEALRARMHKRQFADAAALRSALRDMLVERLQPVEQALEIDGHAPFLLLVVGVNGVGKTTTIGKLARHARNQAYEVMLAAGDTFRAAAVEQLQAWGERNGVAVISQGQGADSASVVFDALQSARARGADLLIADTAGRLHTQAGLMDELAKIARVAGKLDASAPHEVLMVIDGGTGQNAISQVRQFHAMVNLTGLVVTKLDGTAKGGVVFALAREFGLPIRYVGLGEGLDDLRVFNAQHYVDGLLPESASG